MTTTPSSRPESEGDASVAPLEQVQLAKDDAPERLEARWHQCANAKDWDACLDVAKAITRAIPNSPFSWIRYGYASRQARRGDPHEAFEALLPIAQKFPEHPAIAYNLACYACQIGRLDEAREWLRQATEKGDPEQVKRMALDDRDLEPLRTSVEEL